MSPMEMDIERASDSKYTLKKHSCKYCTTYCNNYKCNYCRNLNNLDSEHKVYLSCWTKACYCALSFAFLFGSIAFLYGFFHACS